VLTVPSFFGALLQGWRPARDRTERRLPTRDHLERVRAAMLHALAGAADERATTLARRIRISSDVQQLWYLRPELMATLASAHGEASASDTLARITSLFGSAAPAPPGRTAGRA